MSLLLAESPHRAELTRALEHADRVFQPHYRAPVPLCMHCDFTPKGLAESPAMQRFDAIVRAHRSRRLEMPIAMIWDTALGHTRGIFHNDLRRLAWFVPPMLVAMLDDDLRSEALRVLASTGQELGFVHTFEARADDPPWFTAQELAALDDFLVALLPLTVAAPAWKESVPLLAISHYFRSDQRRLAATWAALDPLSLANAVLEEYLQPESFGPEAVRAALEAVVLGAGNAQIAARCSEAEQLLWSRLGHG